MENVTVENATEKINGTKTEISSAEGLMIAYFSLVAMALIPIYFGSIRSIEAHKKKKDSGEEVETLTVKDAAMFPFIASGALFSIYLIFRIFSKEYVNMLLTFYFVGLGLVAVTKSISPVLHALFSDTFQYPQYHLELKETKASDTSSILNHRFDRLDIISLGLSTLIAVWYFLKKHWIANNFFGLAFAVNAVELLHLNKVVTGCILLCGLFIYDIFWVFGTTVMVSVAKSFEAPIKLVFPRDIIARGIWATDYAMLGLGDIVIPGVFIALLLRFDQTRSNKRFYFYTCFISYILGLGITILVMHVFKAAQPALLYIVPSCVGIPLIIACIKGDVGDMFKYEDNPAPEEMNAAGDSGSKKNK